MAPGETEPLIEAVRVGAAMIRHCLAEAERQGLRLVQLTSNARRTDAHRFYERLGFIRSHFGFKYKLK